jgi:hypothetical protein
MVHQLYPIYKPITGKGIEKLIIGTNIPKKGPNVKPLSKTNLYPTLKVKFGIIFRVSSS